MLAFKAQNTFHRILISYPCCNLGKARLLRSTEIVLPKQDLLRMSSGRQDQ